MNNTSEEGVSSYITHAAFCSCFACFLSCCFRTKYASLYTQCDKVHTYNFESNNQRSGNHLLGFLDQFCVIELDCGQSKEALGHRLLWELHKHRALYRKIEETAHKQDTIQTCVNTSRLVVYLKFLFWRSGSSHLNVLCLKLSQGWILGFTCTTQGIVIVNTTHLAVLAEESLKVVQF